MRKFLALCAWLFALFFLQSGLGAPAQAIEADALREKLVDSLEFAGAFTGPKSMKPRGFKELLVEPDGEGFRVTVSEMRILIDAQENFALQLPQLSFAMTPEPGGPEGDLFRLSDLILPETVVVTTTDEAWTYRLKLSGFHFEALWSFAVQYYLEIDSQIEQTEIFDDGGAKVFSMNAWVAKMDNKRRDSGTYDMTMTVQYGDVGVFTPDGVGTLDHGRAAADWGNVNFVAYERLVREMQSAAPEEEDFPQFAARQFGLLMDPVMRQGEGEMLFEGNGLRLTDPSGAEISGLDSFGLRFGASDLSAPLARVNFRINHKGFRLGPDYGASDPLFGDLVPKEMALSIVFDNLPSQELFSQMMGMLADPATGAFLLDPDSAAAQDAPPDAMLPMFDDLQNLFLSSNTSLAINDSHLKSSAAEIMLDGKFNLDPTAAFIGWGSLLAEIIGLDNLMALAQQQAESSDPVDMEAAAGALGMLSMLQVFSNRTMEEGGQTRDSYKVELSPAGEVKVNDQLVMGAE